MPSDQLSRVLISTPCRHPHDVQVDIFLEVGAYAGNRYHGSIDNTEVALSAQYSIGADQFGDGWIFQSNLGLSQ